MNCYLKIIAITVLTSKFKLSNQSTCGTSASFQLLSENSRAAVDVLLSDFAQFFSICAHLCLVHKLCMSFSYNVEASKCEILSYNHIGSETKRPISSPGWRSTAAKVVLSYSKIL